MIYTNGKVLIRDYINADYDTLLNLDIKEKDVIELYNMTNMTPKEYMSWHLDTYSSETKVIEYDSVVVGMLGIDESILWFTTIQLTRQAEFSLVRMYIKVLIELMNTKNIKTVSTYVDSNYIETLKWIELGGFKRVKEVEINNNKFYIMKFTIK